MSGPEDRLAAVLRGEAELLEPGTDRLPDIRRRVAARQTRRRVALSATALGAVVAVLGGLAVTGGGPASLQPAPQASQATTTPTPSPAPAPSGPAADPDGSTTSVPGTPFWPFTSDVEAAAWAADPGTRTWADDPVSVAQHLADDLLDLDLTASRSGEAVVLGTTGEFAEVVASVQLAQIGTGPERPWTVLGVTSADGGRPLRITSPAPATEVTSPLAVSGTVPGVDESVRVSLRTAAGALLAEQPTPAGSAAPWSTSLRWTEARWTTGVVYAVTRSPRDGAVSRLAAIPVLRGAAPRAVPAATEAFVADLDGTIGLYDATDGRLLQRVSFPPAGYTDTSPRRSGTKVLWLRLGRECTDRKVISRDLATDVTTTLVSGEPLVPGALAASPDGRWTSWATQQTCGNAQESPTVVHVRGPSGTRTTSFDWMSDVSDLDLRDGGALLVQITGQDGGYLSLRTPDGGSVDLDAATDCLLFNGDFLGDRVVALEACDPFADDPPPLRRVELSLAGRRLSTVATTLPSVARLTAAGNQVLVQRFEPSGAVGRLVGGRFEAFLEQPACRETLEARGCVTEIDW